jgi:hypothetical protein
MNQIERMQYLMGYRKVEETAKHNTGALEYHSVASDGKVYGIVRENTKYYIKVADKGEKQNLAESYDYIGGFCNRKNHEYDSYNKALKQYELKLRSINEAMGVKTDVTTLNPFKKGDVIVEETEKMRAEIARQRQIMYNAGRILGESTETIGFEYTGVPEAPKTANAEPKTMGGPYTDKAEAVLDKDLKAKAESPKTQGTPFEKDVNVTDKDMQSDKKESDNEPTGEPFDKKAEYVPKDAVANMHPSGGKVVRVNENEEWGSEGLPSSPGVGDADGEGDPFEETVTECDEWGSAGLPSSPGVGDGADVPFVNEGEDLEEALKYVGSTDYGDGSKEHIFQTKKNYYGVGHNKNKIPTFSKYSKPKNAIKEDDIMDPENFVGFEDENENGQDLETLLSQWEDDAYDELEDGEDGYERGRPEWNYDTLYGDDGPDARRIRGEIDAERALLQQRADELKYGKDYGRMGEGIEVPGSEAEAEKATAFNDEDTMVASEGKVIEQVTEAIMRTLKEAVEGGEQKQYNKWLDIPWFKNSGYSPFRKHYDALLGLYNQIRTSDDSEQVNTLYNDFERKSDKLIKVLDGIKNGKKLSLKPQEEASYKAIIGHNPQGADQMIASIKKMKELGSHHWDEKYAQGADEKWEADNDAYNATKPVKTTGREEGNELGSSKIPGTGRKSYGNTEKGPSNAQLKSIEREFGLGEGVVKKLTQTIMETVLNDFGKHPGYRKKPFTTPPIDKNDSDVNDGYKDWNDDSTRGEEEFGKQIGSSAPFDQKVKLLTDTVMNQLKEAMAKKKS